MNFTTAPCPAPVLAYPMLVQTSGFGVIVFMIAPGKGYPLRSDGFGPLETDWNQQQGYWQPFIGTLTVTA